jgi:hypothetical protein
LRIVLDKCEKVQAIEWKTCPLKGRFFHPRSLKYWMIYNCYYSQFFVQNFLSKFQRPRMKKRIFQY